MVARVFRVFIEAYHGRAFGRNRVFASGLRQAADEQEAFGYLYLFCVCRRLLLLVPARVWREVERVLAGRRVVLPGGKRGGGGGERFGLNQRFGRRRLFNFERHENAAVVSVVCVCFGYHDFLVAVFSERQRTVILEFDQPFLYGLKFVAIAGWQQFCALGAFRRQ